MGQSLGSLVGAFIWIGLFMGLLVFVASSILLIFALIDLTLKIEDNIKRRRNDIRTVGICASRIEPYDKFR
jgi:hypothetical protein